MLTTLLRLALAVPTASAQLTVNIGTPLSWEGLTRNIINFLAASIGFLAVAIFIYGALLLTASGAHEEWKNKGKDIMIGSLVAMVIVLGAYAILRTVAFFVLAP